MKHSKIRDGKRLVWQTERLWELAAGLEPFERETETFAELDIDCWFGPEKSPTLREVTGHTTRIMNADLEIPVILNDDGSLMDGGHRLCRALLEGRKYIKAVQFQEMPKPDKILEL